MLKLTSQMEPASDSMFYFYLELRYIKVDLPNRARMWFYFYLELRYVKVDLPKIAFQFIIWKTRVGLDFVPVDSLWIFSDILKIVLAYIFRNIQRVLPLKKTRYFRVNCEISEKMSFRKCPNVWIFFDILKIVTHTDGIIMGSQPLQEIYTKFTFRIIVISTQCVSINICSTDLTYNCL